MVKVGFIVEGETEKVIIDSVPFISFLRDLNIEMVRPVINATGNGNLLPQNINGFIAAVKKGEPEKIIILTDSEELSIEEVKQRINPAQSANPDIDLIVVAVKAFEAWFLANEGLMRQSIQISDFNMDKPEETDGLPYDYIKAITADNRGKGPGGKVLFAKRVLKNGFSLREAANHPNCPSARYFYEKLVQIGNGTFCG